MNDSSSSWPARSRLFRGGVRWLPRLAAAVAVALPAAWLLSRWLR